MEDIAMAVDLEGAQNEAKGATNRQVAEDNQNTARVEQNPKKEGKVAESLDEAAEVVMEGLDGANGNAAEPDDNAAGLSQKKKRPHRRGKNINLRKRQLHRRQQQPLDRKPAGDESGHGAVSAPRAAAGTCPIIPPHGDRGG